MHNAVICTFSLYDVIGITRHLHIKLKSFSKIAQPLHKEAVRGCSVLYIIAETSMIMSETFLVEASIPLQMKILNTVLPIIMHFLKITIPLHCIHHVLNAVLRMRHAWVTKYETCAKLYCRYLEKKTPTRRQLCLCNFRGGSKISGKGVRKYKCVRGSLC